MNQKTKKITKIFEWDGKITSPHPQPFSLMRRREKSAAFTLAETLITVVILGILAAILVPNLIKNQVENANRTKVKKAMAAYEKAINFMIVENDIKSTENLRELGQDNCQYTREYFKTVQDGANNCIFKTADRVWWDITDITNPIISLKDEITNDNTAAIRVHAQNLSADKTSFALIGRFDDVGSLRIDDNAYEQGLKNNDTNKKYMTKLWYFIGNLQLTDFAKCKAERKTTCVVNVNGEDIEYELVHISDEFSKSGLCIYDRESKTTKCGQTSRAIAGDYYIKRYSPSTEEEAKEEVNCESSIYNNCAANGDYWNVAKRKCESQGARLPNVAELMSLQSQGKLPIGTWTSDEYYENYAYVFTGLGNIYHDEKNRTIREIICVGNE